MVDTSAFLTDDIRREGESLTEACERLLGTIERSKEADDSVFYIPASTFEELEEILEESASKDVIDEIKTVFRVQSPPRHEMKIPGDVLYDFIKEMRERTHRGLRTAEKAVKQVGEMEEEPDHEYYDKEDVVISDLRDKYKEKMRKGILDSEEDLDLILLAREHDATLVTEDNGVINWADELGIKRLRGRDLPTVLEKDHG